MDPERNEHTALVRHGFTDPLPRCLHYLPSRDDGAQHGSFFSRHSVCFKGIGELCDGSEALSALFAFLVISEIVRLLVNVALKPVMCCAPLSFIIPFFFVHISQSNMLLIYLSIRYAWAVKKNIHMAFITVFPGSRPFVERVCMCVCYLFFFSLPF